MIDEAAILQQLNLGTSREVLEGNPASPLATLLQQTIQTVIEQLAAKMDEYDINASSNLKQSMEPTDVTKEGTTVSIGLEMDFYWKFVNYGVNGTVQNHGAPAWGSTPGSGLSFKEEIGQWIRNRGIQLPAQFSTYEQFQYAIITNIIKNGKAPRPFFIDVVNDTLIAQIREPIEALFKRAITIQIVEPWQ